MTIGDRALKPICICITHLFCVPDAQLANLWGGGLQPFFTNPALPLSSPRLDIHITSSHVSIPRKRG